MTYNARADNTGQIPEAGDFVAYNYSGQIATGWITKIGETHGRYWSGPIFHIYQCHPKDGHMSRVRGGPKCVLVLAKRDPLFPKEEADGKSGDSQGSA